MYKELYAKNVIVNAENFRKKKDIAKKWRIVYKYLANQHGWTKEGFLCTERKWMSLLSK